MRLAIRALIARPGFTIVAVVTLAIGFGVNAAIFSLTRTVLLRPLPYRDADRLLQVGEANASLGVSYSPAVPANYLVWRERATAFETTAAWRVVSFSVAGQTPPMRVQGVRIEPSFFPLLGVTPALGRNFIDDDSVPGRDDVVLLGNSFWQRQFAGDPAIVGRTLTIDRVPCTVVGVLPASFKFFRVINRELDVWRPFRLDATDREHSVTVYAKLKPGVALESAQAELATIQSALPAEAFRDGWTQTAARLSTRFTLTQRPILAALEVAVALVMCIAAANIANLILASAAGRRRDVAVRVALGATRWQLMTELGRETLLLASAGAAVGVLLAIWIVDLLNGSVSYQDINRLEPFRVDLAVVGFTIVLATASALVFALLPARRAADADVVEALKESSHGATASVTHRRMRAALVVAELALSIVLLTSALELTRTAWSLNTIDRGVDVGRVMTAQLSLNAPQYAETRRLTQFADTIVERLTSSPAIASASTVNYPPLSIIGTSTPIAIEGQPAMAGKEPFGQYWVVSPRYFATVGVPVLAGRDFDRSDTNERLGVAIVSRRFAQRFWNRLDAVGERVTPLFPQSDAFWIPRTTRRPLTIVGVVEDVREEGIPGHPDERQPQFYLPYSQNPTRILTLVARTPGPPETAAPVFRDAVRSIDPDQPTFDEKTLDEVRSETFARSRELAWLIGAFAVLALLLAAVGVYGVIAYLTTARGREIGIRVALGASRSDIVRMVVGDAMRLAVAGVAIGAVLSPIASRLAGAWIAGLDGSHPASLALVAALLAIVCAGAAAIPARRAANLKLRT
jgi:putative ABC transport system permease protein